MGAILVTVITERWLRIIGFIAWLVAGSTSIVRFMGGAKVPVVWVAAYIGFAVLFFIGSDRRASRMRRIVCLVGQALTAVTLAMIGLPHFEGALLALVAGQLPLVVPVWAAVVWALVQALPLWASINSRYGPVDVGKSISSYLAFSAFAVAVVHLFQSERRARVELALAGERVRISRELHDVLGHHLAALKIHLDLARRKADEASRGPLADAHDIAKQMLTDVRATVGEMASDGTMNLRAKLEAMAKVPEPKISLDHAKALDIQDPMVAHVALRCVMEAVTNARKHANANKVKVVLSPDGDDLVIVVEDDGANAGNIEEANGLRGMRDRIEELGGTLEVVSTAGKGTTIRARLPLEAT
jgi:signal transduction histidine kinase